MAVQQPHVVDRLDRGDFVDSGAEKSSTDIQKPYSSLPLMGSVRPPNEPRVARREGAVALRCRFFQRSAS